jgi:cation diffusion facilitator CzcD-associated flavoprotein CzcO
MSQQAAPDATAAGTTTPIEVDVAIVGSGFSGLGTAIRLRQAGLHDFVVLERGDDVGGTWHFNTYPGCACDVPSHLYSFSFAPNPEWSETYSRQPEIGAYLRRCADEFGVRPHVRLHHAVTGAAWDDEAQRWDVETSQGPFRARVLIAGMGPLAEPKLPDVPGVETFEGATFHSARWDHDFDFKGKRVASVGTGASAIQYVPAIQPEVEQLYVVQRTPPWVVPHTNREIRGWERRLYKAFPPAQRLVRGGIYLAREWLVLGFVKNPRIMGIVERLARRHMREQIDDARLLEKVTPDYTIGCKRILPSNRWYRALSQPNVELLTGGVAEIRPHSIVTGDGEEREVDAIVYGTGFQVTDMPVGRLVRGRDGQTLDDAWRGSPRAHLGTAVPGFPNLFVLLGPNTGLGHSSMVYMIESQIAHVMDALRVMADRGAETIEVAPEAAARFNSDVDARMQGTVWSTGCASWYIDRTGRNATLWPDWTWRFRQRTRRVSASDYRLGAAGAGAARAAQPAGAAA